MAPILSDPTPQQRRERRVVKMKADPYPSFYVGNKMYTARHRRRVHGALEAARPTTYLPKQL
jgi:hypothetical protein